MTTTQLPRGLDVLGPMTETPAAEVLTTEALEFLVDLHRHFNHRRLELLRQRAVRRQALRQGERPNFLSPTRSIRESDWLVDPVPADLQDRRVEITGPVDRKMVINALNSGAKCYMADFEDAHSPTWIGTLEGQVNVRDAVRGTIEHESAEGKSYRLNDSVATLLVRPRGWHLPEKHLLVDGEYMSGSLFDFGLYFFHNAEYRVRHGSGVYLYLPKLEHHLEARLWNEVFLHAQQALGLPVGSIKATVLIEHILAAFQMEEILFELRHHSAGLNCGRWDYIFSYIKTFGVRDEFLVPDRAQVTMTTPFMRAYTLACVQACHKRGAFAMGGMSAYIPVKADPVANERAMAQVRADKHREAEDGFDGTWVAHPGLVGVAQEEFDRVLGSKPNQIGRQRQDPAPSPEQLLEAPQGTITEEGLRHNIRVALQYLASWLAGQGCVPLYNLMEDAATAEISRTQVWQWIHHPRGVLEDGRKVSLPMVRQWMREELEALRQRMGEAAFEKAHFHDATRLFDALIASEALDEFLTLKAYRLLD